MRSRRIAIVSAIALAVAAVATLTGMANQSSAALRTTLRVPPSTPTSCAVTFPNRKNPPESASSALPPVPPAFHGNGKLWVKFWPFGVIVASPRVIQADGSIAIKLPWWRNVNGALTITGVRVDAHAPPITSDVPAGYGNRGFQPSDVVFPTQGCWRVTGRVASAALTFVVLVVKANTNGY
jgi:hypothetical protein